MNYYHAWCNLKDTSRDLEFSEDLKRYLGHLEERGLIAGYRLARRKLGFGPKDLGEFHVCIEVEGLVQLERAFDLVATREETIERLHAAVFTAIRDVTFALYRDYPDPGRVAGGRRGS